MCTDRDWMAHALALGAHAEQQGEVPVGAVIVRDNILLGEGWNQPILSNDPTAHAEIQALRSACSNAHNYRLPDATLYVTLEPCIMCTGAIIHARIKRVVFAAAESTAGTAGSCFDIFNATGINHRVDCDYGILAEQSSTLLKSFFLSRR